MRRGFRMGGLLLLLVLEELGSCKNTRYSVTPRLSNGTATQIVVRMVDYRMAMPKFEAFYDWNLKFAEARIETNYTTVFKDPVPCFSSLVTHAIDHLWKPLRTLRITVIWFLAVVQLLQNVFMLHKCLRYAKQKPSQITLSDFYKKSAADKTEKRKNCQKLLRQRSRTHIYSSMNSWSFIPLEWCRADTL